MTDEEIEIRSRLKNDFIHYAEKCLKIRTKKGHITPFSLNKAQLYIHKKLEEQKKEIGKVRALILKGRQQGCCYTSDMKVLMSDYRWLTLDEIKVGDKIVACDEESVNTTKSGRKGSRKFRTAIVEAKAEFFKKIYQISLDNGAIIKVTGDHRMLSKQRGGDYQIWRHISDFKIGDLIRVATRPPNYSSTYEDGWIAGMIDGEGSMRGKNGGSKRISIHQVAGPVLDRIKTYFKNIDMPYCEVLDKRTSGLSSKLGDKPVHRIDIHRLPYIIELLSRCRPTKFTNNELHIGHELPGKAAQHGISPWAKIIGIKELGIERVIDLQTSEKTYICEGLVSHNSTYVGARFYHRTTYNRGIQTFILTHELKATDNLFKMAKRFYDNTPIEVKPQIKTNNAKELNFGLLDSGYSLGTAENKSTGRSSTIQYLHGSEVGFWTNAAEHATGVFQAVPDINDTEIILESTANGVGNYFHQMWQKAESGESDYIAIFIPWFWQEEYKREVPEDFEITPEESEVRETYKLSNGQILWRRYKIIDLSINGQDGAKAFKQEYPCNATEAFQLTGQDNFIDPELVMLARKCNAERHGPLVMGVDPAREGSDRTAIIFRQGRQAFGLETYKKDDLMEVVGIIHNKILEFNPAKVCIDAVGLGAGLFDRLKELGHSSILYAVKGGENALDKNKYVNKRAEMWGLLHDWLLDDPCQIPDSDELHADVCNIRKKYDSNSRLIMEKKEDMKKRGIRSPDTADALTYTFALPASALLPNKPTDPILKSLASDFTNKLNATRRSRNRPL